MSKLSVGRGRIDDDHNGIKSLLKARKVSSRHSVPAKIRPRDRDSFQADRSATRPAR
ncbi:hypothetical protein [Mesorhizobium sp. M0296]|uniref:hypothetical protein n=1 Tax=Mesorhizobium sp. M0296 TaxID=2956931 RepID=UPI00333946E1